MWALPSHVGQEPFAKLRGSQCRRYATLHGSRPLFQLLWQYLFVRIRRSRKEFIFALLRRRLLYTVTSTTLLDGLRDAGNMNAWKRFMGRYQPMVVSFCKSQGLSHSDAEDVAQETMLAFAKSYNQGGYDREKGRLGNWLFSIAHKKVMDVFRRRMKENVVSAPVGRTGIMQSIPSPDSMAEIWENQWRQYILRACLEEVARLVKPQTYRAFELYVLDQWTVEAVAEHLGITENAVYIAKNRVISRVRKIQPKMEESW